MRNLAVFLVAVTLLGCNQYKYPRNEKRALKQLKKSTAKIKQITHIYPDLIDTVFKTKNMLDETFDEENGPLWRVQLVTEATMEAAYLVRK